MCIQSIFETSIKGLGTNYILIKRNDTEPSYYVQWNSSTIVEDTDDVKEQDQVLAFRRY